MKDWLKNLLDKYVAPLIKAGDLRPLQVIEDWLNDVLKEYLRPGVEFVLDKPWLKWPVIAVGAAGAASVAGGVIFFFGVAIEIAAVIGATVGVLTSLVEIFAGEFVLNQRERERLEQNLRNLQRDYNNAQASNNNIQAMIDQLNARNQQLQSNNQDLHNANREERAEHERIRRAYVNLQTEHVSVRARVAAYQARCDTYMVPHDDLDAETSYTSPIPSSR